MKKQLKSEPQLSETDVSHHNKTAMLKIEKKGNNYGNTLLKAVIYDGL